MVTGYLISKRTHFYGSQPCKVLSIHSSFIILSEKKKEVIIQQIAK